MRPFERVHTLTDFYDVPRGGIADLEGRPHQYKSQFADFGPGEDHFELRRIDDATLQLALEDWAIWQRWEDAFDAGTATTATHPALPDERARHDEIAVLLADRLARLDGPPVIATAVFRVRPGFIYTFLGRNLEVQWTPVVGHAP